MTPNPPTTSHCLLLPPTPFCCLAIAFHCLPDGQMGTSKHSQSLQQHWRCTMLLVEHSVTKPCPSALQEQGKFFISGER